MKLLRRNHRAGVDRKTDNTYKRANQKLHAMKIRIARLQNNTHQCYIIIG